MNPVRKFRAKWKTMRGISLLKRAEKAPISKAIGYYEAAFRRFADAVAIDPAMSEAWLSWGHGLYNLARKQSGKEQQRGYRAACEKYELAHQYDPDDFDPLKFWGLSLRRLAQNKREKNPDPLYLEAYDKFARAVRIEDKTNDSYHHWGLTLYQHAEKKSGNHAQKLLQEACEHFASSDAVNANQPHTLNDWGASLMALSTLADAAEAKQLRTEAREKCLAAENTVAGFASYNLACIASMSNDPEECRRYLEIAHTHYKIPSPGQLENDPDLANVRKLGWFKALAKKVREEF